MSPSFLRAIAFTLSDHIEGGLSLDKNDRGNWTSGKVGEGELKGSKYGISAMTYPQLDIRSVTRDQARAIYFRDFWLKYDCERLPPRLAFAYLDTLVNTKPEYAAKILQAAVGVKQDGVVGNVTLAAARTMDQAESVPNFLAERALFYTTLRQFPKYGRGWLERVVRLAMEVGK